MFILYVGLIFLTACKKESNIDLVAKSNQSFEQETNVTDQLDVLGIVPGVSEISQIKEASTKNPAYDSDFSVQLEIGGHKMLCLPYFIKNKIAQLGCMTGEKFTNASNINIHKDLAAGFTKKFGKPSFNESGNQRTVFGVNYEKNIISWMDKKGNKLTLYSMLDNVNVGLINLESMEYLKELTKQAGLKEKQKKF